MPQSTLHDLLTCTPESSHSAVRAAYYLGAAHALHDHVGPPAARAADVWRDVEDVPALAQRQAE